MTVNLGQPEWGFPRRRATATPPEATDAGPIGDDTNETGDSAENPTRERLLEQLRRRRGTTDEPADTQPPSPAVVRVPRDGGRRRRGDS